MSYACDGLEAPKRGATGTGVRAPGDGTGKRTAGLSCGTCDLKTCTSPSSPDHHPWRTATQSVSMSAIRAHGE
eukprot:XP_001699545.1 predicted protein [Chlamydomonas reinhardtii]